MEIVNAYDVWVKAHVKRRSGHGAARIKEGLQHAEKLFVEHVWWPAFHNLDGLHPEFEIRDFQDGYRYIDFAYIQKHFKVAIEIDGMGPHWKNISQQEFSDHYERQNHLVIDDWHVLRFTYNDICDRPRTCQQTVQQLIGHLSADSSKALKMLKLTDREILRLALGSNRPITARDIANHLNLGNEAATRHLRMLSHLSWLEPASGATRIRSYRVHPSRVNIHL